MLARHGGPGAGEAEQRRDDGEQAQPAGHRDDGARRHPLGGQARAECAEALDDLCPNCGGELVDRPTRSKPLQAKSPPSNERQFKA